jgi:hypothetical protein
MLPAGFPYSLLEAAAFIQKAVERKALANGFFTFSAPQLFEEVVAPVKELCLNPRHRLSLLSPANVDHPFPWNGKCHWPRIFRAEPERPGSLTGLDDGSVANARIFDV